jgi:DNA-binding cell septation regulator SpoVG
MLAERKTQLEEYKDINHVHRRKTRQEELNRLEFDYMV